MVTIIVWKDECIPTPTGVGHSNRRNDLASTVEPSASPLAEVEFSHLLGCVNRCMTALEDRNSINGGL